MKRFTLLILVLSIALLSSCKSSNTPATQDSTSSTKVPSLLVSGGDISKAYTRPDLEKLPASQATFKGVTYKGVTVSALLQDAGFDLTQIKAVKAVASDGFSTNYDTSQVLADDVIVAYAGVDGDMTENDGSFRMVLPGAEGKLNVRMLTELKIIK